MRPGREHGGPAEESAVRHLATLALRVPPTWVAIGLVVLVSLTMAALLVAGLAGDERRDVRDEPAAGRAAGRAPAPAVAFHATRPSSPRVAAYAAAVLGEAVTLDADDLDGYLRLRATESGRGQVSGFLERWQPQLLLDVGGADPASLDVRTVGHRVVAQGRRGEETLRRLVLFAEVAGAPGAGAQGNVLVTLTVADGPAGLRLDALTSVAPVEGDVESLPGVFRPVEGA